ncbi:MAG TPA: amino acid ABC transporter permease [Rhodobacteraceae bacterium]|nr:amino acid ABC transporter permease [Paracoccaceae bacterium]
MSSEPYVRTEMLSEQPAPLGQTGILRWMRENLFSSIPNAIISILAFLFVVFLLSKLLPWVIQPSWSSESLGNCIEDPNITGACWGVIRSRFNQLMFGFYPHDLQWRPLLAFFMMLTAVAPVLFAKVPRKMLWFSAIYPFIGVWLLWGGSIWGPAMSLAGFVIGFLAHKYLKDVVGNLTAMIIAVLATIIWWLYGVGPVAGGLASVIPINITEVISSDFGGLMLSITIGVSAIAFSLPLGIILALGRQSDMFIIKVLCVGFIEFIRGVPLITLLFVASVLLNFFLPPGTNFDLILRVIIMVTIFSAAYMAEVIRGGLAGLPTGQYEAADALGLNYWQSMQLIIMPQALKISIPGIVGTFIGVFKDTTLVSLIGLLDPVGLIVSIQGTTEWTGIVWELYLFIAVMFWVFTFSMSRYSMYLENKLKTTH